MPDQKNPEDEAKPTPPAAAEGKPPKIEEVPEGAAEARRELEPEHEVEQQREQQRAPREKPRPAPQVEEVPPPPPGSGEGVPGGPAEPEEIAGREGFGSRLDEILTELNLERKHIVTACGCLVGIVVFLIVGYFAYGYFFGDRAAEEEETEERPAIEESSEIQTGIKIAEPPAFLPERVTGIGSAVTLGEPQDVLGSSFRSYIITIRRMQNAYATDVQQLLDRANDRRGVLQNHLTQLRGALAEGETQFARLLQEKNSVTAPFEQAADEKIAAEEGFFAAVETLDAASAEERLQQFIANSQATVALRARFQGLEKLSSFYDQALPRLRARIEDIRLNEEALVKGIKVFDIKGSDLELIIREE